MNADWLYTFRKTYRQIATFELLASLPVVVLDMPEASECRLGCSAATDNKGNDHLVSRLLTA